jgi:hypothetical protein
MINALRRDGYGNPGNQTEFDRAGFDCDLYGLAFYLTAVSLTSGTDTKTTVREG